MAFIRRRTTKTGAISTALVEPYRDAEGRPRQRLLANLHGEPDVLSALGKLTAILRHRDHEREELSAEYERVSQKPEETKRQLNILVRLQKIERQMDIVCKDARALMKHCTDDEIEAAAGAHVERINDTVTVLLGAQMASAQGHAAQTARAMKAQFRRLTMVRSR
jgi:hypothetical protein